ncbi:MAG TPA: HAD family hydrolase, partial [Chloroflexota bacterium]|nr:HAD family hydrolase [Chloroflexota bacterium]
PAARELAGRSGDGELRAVVFDYGHTLLDFAVAEDRMLEAYERVREMLAAEAAQELPGAEAFVEALTRRIAQEVSESYARRELEELDVVDMFDLGLQTLGFRLSRDMVRAITEIEHRAMASRLEVPEANLDTLRELRAMGLKLGVVSNAHFLPEMMREDLRRVGIADLVDDMVFSAEIGVRKPHPAIFLKVLETISVPPASALFVGDRLRDDVSGAKALGMRGVLTHEFRQEEIDPDIAVPDAVIRRLPEVVPLVRRLAGAATGPSREG